MRLLNELHHQIQHLTDRFSADTPDEQWLPQIASDGDLILVSADPTITTARKEKEVWRRTGLTSFFLASGFADKAIWAQVLEVVRWWPEVVTTAKTATRGTGYLLPFKGKVPQKLYSAFKVS